MKKQRMKKIITYIIVICAMVFLLSGKLQAETTKECKISYSSQGITFLLARNLVENNGTIRWTIQDSEGAPFSVSKNSFSLEDSNSEDYEVEGDFYKIICTCEKFFNDTLSIEVTGDEEILIGNYELDIQEMPEEDSIDARYIEQNGEEEEDISSVEESNSGSPEAMTAFPDSITSQLSDHEMTIESDGMNIVITVSEEAVEKNNIESLKIIVESLEKKNDKSAGNNNEVLTQTISIKKAKKDKNRYRKALDLTGEKKGKYLVSVKKYIPNEGESAITLKEEEVKLAKGISKIIIFVALVLVLIIGASIVLAIRRQRGRASTTRAFVKYEIRLMVSESQWETGYASQNSRRLEDCFNEYADLSDNLKRTLHNYIIQVSDSGQLLKITDRSLNQEYTLSKDNKILPIHFENSRYEIIWIGERR